MYQKIILSLCFSISTLVGVFPPQAVGKELGDTAALVQPQWLHSVTVKLDELEGDGEEGPPKGVGEREILGERFGLLYRLRNRESSSWNLQPRFSGWTSVGFHDQNNGLFNNHAHGVNLHQLWMTIESEPTGENG